VAERFRLGGGRLSTLYVAAYTAGRVWIEAMRVDDVNHILGLRLNVWTSLIVFGTAVALLVLRRQTPLSPSPSSPDDMLAAEPTPPKTAASTNAAP
jgi:prolipoprotein diacylglyceryltransferase